MNREQGINYLKSSGFSYEQIKAIEGAFTDSDCISRWALKEDLYEAITNVDVYERVIDIVDRQKAVNVPDNNVGEMDCISRQAVLDVIDAEAWAFCDYLITKGRTEEQKPVSHFACNLRERIGDKKELPPVKPEPCEDAISRQAAIDTYKNLRLPIYPLEELPPVMPEPMGIWEDFKKFAKEEYGYDIALVDAEKGDTLESLFKPEQKLGRWIEKDGNWYCSECDCLAEEWLEKPTYKYCSECGAKMVEPQAERSDKE